MNDGPAPADQAPTMAAVARIGEWDAASWCLAAVAVAGRADAPPDLVQAAHDVVAASGLPISEFPGSPAQLAAVASAPLQVAARVAAGQAATWAEHSDEALRAQGQASGMAGPMFARHFVASMGDLAARLGAAGGRMLDVGTGTGALAIGFAEAFPHLEVVGIDVLDRVLELARDVASASPVGDRVRFRRQDVAGFSDPDGFDLGWLPAPFIPPAVIEAGVRAVVGALRPGGWLLLGHGRPGEAPLEDAVTRLKTVAYGGTVLDGPGAAALLGGAGLQEVRSLPTPPGVPALTVGRRP